tara:strand:+ start:62 stop:211 length:150 start_codon:yes stop_codon:yes gene_type:complete
MKNRDTLDLGSAGRRNERQLVTHIAKKVASVKQQATSAATLYTLTPGSG